VTDYRYVDAGPALAQLLAGWGAESLVAVDTEAASFHRYVDRVYLVQLSTRRETAIIDPLAVDLAPLGVLLADPAVEKIFHDADYDLRTLDRDYGFRARALWDTRIAAQLTAEPAIGLSALLEKHLGVRLPKDYQKADWSLRPLSPEMLAYAADDTRHLPALRDALRDRLTTLGRLAWAEEEFQRLEDLRWSGPGPDGAEAYLRIKGAKALQPRQLAALRALWVWRESVAVAQDKATFRIVGNDALLGLARALPADAAGLAQVRELPPVLARRHGAPLLGAVAEAIALPESELPRLARAPRLAKDPDWDARMERLKAARNRVAQELALDPGVLCGKSILEAVARARPSDRAGLERIPELRRWQVTVLGDVLLTAI